MEPAGSKDALYPCPYCGKSFMRRLYLSCHMAAHKSPPLECDSCRRQFGRADSLRRHRCPTFSTTASKSTTSKSKVPVRPRHECPRCQKTYSRRESLLQHVSRYHEEAVDGSDGTNTIQVHPCLVCRRVFASALSLHNHEVLIHGGAALADSVGFSCGGCGRQFSSQLNVDRHICPNAPGARSSHPTLVKPQVFSKRPVVPKPSTRESDCRFPLVEESVNMPQQSSAEAVEIKKYTCHLCGRTFSSTGWLRRHISATHTSRAEVQRASTGTADQSGSCSANFARTRAHVCSVCGKSLSSAGNLNKHLLTHGPRRETCRECGRQFHQRVSLRQHMNSVHAPPGSFAVECSVCGLRMRSRNSLYSHVARFHRTDSDSSSPPRPHVCQTCGRGFHQCGNLRKHELTHSVDAPYVCPDCPCRLRTAERLRRHQTWHQHGKQFKCAECEHSFVQPSDLRRHIAFCHSAANDTYRCCYCGVCCQHYQTMRRHLRRRHPDQMSWQTDVRGFISSLSIRMMKDRMLTNQTQQATTTVVSACSQIADVQEIQVTEVPLIIGSENDLTLDSCPPAFLCLDSSCLSECTE